MQWTRRNFLWRGLAFLGAGRLLAACSSSTTSGGVVTGGNCATNGTSVSISVVHTPNHTLTVPTADVTAGVAKSYTLADNGSGHTHTIDVTAAMFTSLQSNTGVSVISTTVGHNHTVTINCA